MPPSLPDLTWVTATRDLADPRIKTGTVGGVVYIYAGGAGYEVEFFDAEDQTISVETVELLDVAPLIRDDHTAPRAVA